MNFTSTGRARVQSVKCCVLYDAADGSIRYTHRVVTMEGADETPEEQMEQRTRHLAKELGLEVKTLHALHVNAHDIEPNKRYAVDPRKRCLVAVERAIDKGPSSRPRPRQRGKAES